MIPERPDTKELDAMKSIAMLLMTIQNEVCDSGSLMMEHIKTFKDYVWRNVQP